MVQEREAADISSRPANGGQDRPEYYETLEDSIRFANDVVPA